MRTITHMPSITSHGHQRAPCANWFIRVGKSRGVVVHLPAALNAVFCSSAVIFAPISLIHTGFRHRFLIVTSSLWRKLFDLLLCSSINLSSAQLNGYDRTNKHLIIICKIVNCYNRMHDDKENNNIIEFCIQFNLHSECIYTNPWKATAHAVSVSMVPRSRR